MTTLLLDTHALYWHAVSQELLSPRANAAIRAADELAVAGITWYELAWLLERRKIRLALPAATWLTGLGSAVRTVGVTPAIALTAASLPSSFPGDPADRLIYATAIEHGWLVVSKDRRMRDHAALGPGVIW